ncbi:MAG: ATP-dependent DNA helicase RecG [Bacilli bacterium]|nr:ATP-dependent DNA helicase RecG [Bacilli bacterium]
MNNLELIKGIGPKTKEYLNKLNIYNMDDLITHYPFRYEILKRSDVLALNQDDKIIIDGHIESNPTLFRFRGNINKMSFRLRTKELVLNIIIYNRGFLKNNLTIDKVITVIGKWDLKKNTVIASDILFDTLTDSSKIEPIYNTTTGLNKKTLRGYISNALSILNNNIKDYIPSFLSDKYHFLDKYSSLRLIHNPEDVNSLKQAMIRLKYEELFLFMLKINTLKLNNKDLNTGYTRKIDNDKINDFIKSLPFKLTEDQKTSLNEILDDIKAPKRMNRLLQGDVGSGKTIVSVIAIYALYLSGYQSALMAPTEILAKQHYYTIRNLFKDTNIKIELLVGSFTKKEKQNIYDRLSKGEIDLIIGTHALIQKDVIYHKLGLVITDEQHRFGVNQRSYLKEKADMPEVLYMSATPIPRTYALTIYGDMDISSIKTIPLGRKPIITYLKTPKEMKDILTMIKAELDLKHQVYVVAPLIEESDKIDLKDVEKLKYQFELAFKKLYKIGVLHGRMTTSDKEDIMDKFINNDINILISTTVIEVGIDVKNATMMVIFDADRFGLSTIHQLRGRVGRNNLQSYCILISNTEKERLKILTTTNDGFEISEADFKLRGQGDLFGTMQSGDMNFKIADLKKDFKILLQAKEDSMKFLESHLIDNYPHIKEEVDNSINLD